ncbi:hypothetical protein BCV72DRAFT_337193 [Rhizopus microsporus var. microsporus]|uniref:Uncharacterized protein n=2 Tax=Rhizopus microsporus TaxID=58291 RepID=A0A2G4SM35_RHIZD|nr:uncharacterized protein RHIMIDRAFT_294273 [Rhizopus microsporus ATCC 52813]ORE04602.1 hypothetical protein BCV72DRAFT_337193 [Rhizopus microsporus var. microsporus]PHZ09834.1 hypothetical protein RHIMIDRAFT_294273 [Rhizopus microsporus ATCC 52813]
MGQFCRNESIKTDPPMPIFRCHGCGKTFKARTTMYIVQSLAPPNSLVNSSNSGTSRVFHNTQPTQNSNTNDQAHDMQTLLDMIKRFSTELAAVRAEIANLRQQMTELQDQATQQSTNMNQPNHYEDDSHLSSEDFLHYSRKHLHGITLNVFPKSSAALQSMNNNADYNGKKQPHASYNYHLRIKNFNTKLDITDNRILDIHYPDRNVVALLVHNGYVNELRKQLERFKVTLKDDFNPCDPKVLRDPKYVNLSPEERANFALMHHSDRMVRAPAKYAVARFFYSKGWISKTLLQGALPSSRKVSDQVADIFQSDDVTMDNADDLFHEFINTVTRKANQLDQ